MTEEEAHGWLRERFDPAAIDRIAQFADLVVAENGRQNLIAPGTIESIWTRHIVDSAQLLALAPTRWQTWIDIGTGGGFPGMVIALLAPEQSVSLVEPRRRRAEFLQTCCDRLHLQHVEVHACKIEAVGSQADVISARAVASIENLLRSAAHCAKPTTTWLLPRGRSGAAELNSISQVKPAMFHVEHSVTDEESMIVVLRGDVR